jgi:hypothetical protein
MSKMFSIKMLIGSVVNTFKIHSGNLGYQYRYDEVMEIAKGTGYDLGLFHFFGVADKNDIQ